MPYERGRRSSPRDFEKKQDVRSEILAEWRPFECRQSVGGTFCNPERRRDAALAAPLARGLACPRRRLNDLGVCLLVVSKKERTSGTQYEPDGGRFSLSSISAGVEVSSYFHRPALLCLSLHLPIFLGLHHKCEIVQICMYILCMYVSWGYNTYLS